MDTEVRQQQQDQYPTICPHSHNDPEGNIKIKAKDSPIALEESVTNSDAEHATLLDANDISNVGINKVTFKKINDVSNVGISNVYFNLPGLNLAVLFIFLKCCF